VDYLPVSDEGAARVEADFRVALGRVSQTTGIAQSTYGDLPIADGRTLALPTIVAGGRTERIPVLYVRAGPGYATTLGIRILAGRDLRPEDLGPIHRSALTPAASGRRGALVSRRLAERLWPGQAPVGRMIQIGNTQCVVVGVAAGILPALQERSHVEPILVGSQPSGWLGNTLPPLLARTSEPQRDLVATMQRTIQASFLGSTDVRASTFATRLADVVATERLGGSFFGSFGVGVALLALLGAHGLVSMTVIARRKEMAVRAALGAPLTHLRWTVCQPVFVSLLVALIAGAIAAAIGVRILPSELSVLSPTATGYLVGAVAIAGGAIAALASAVSGISGDVAGELSRQGTSF